MATVIEDIWLAEATGLGESLTRENLKQWQIENIGRQIEYARNNGRFYREKFAQYGDLSHISWEQFSKLPFTTQPELALRSQEFLCIPSKNVQRVAQVLTSGTGGTPKRMHFSENDIASTQLYFATGMNFLVKKGDKTVIYFPGTNPDGVSDILRRAVNDIGVEAVMTNGIYDIEKAVKEGEGAQCYCGMPIQLYRLCKKAPHLKPKSILLSADYIPNIVLENFKKIWECDVYPHYGMTEMGLGFAVDCPHHNGMHLRNADIYLEIINPETGEILPDGEVGELVFTTIRREAMPLIRYRTGDIGRMVKSDKICGCGNTMPMLEVVYGRGRDNVLTDGTKGFGIHIIEEILFQNDDICDFVVSKTEDGYRVELEVLNTVDCDEIGFMLEQKFPQQGRFEVEIPKEFVPYRGKRRIENIKYF